MSARDSMEKDFYAMLGVGKDATAAEIKKAYRKLARKLHPDKNSGDAKSEARFKEVSEAYDVLSDPARRAEYDEARALFAGGGFRSGGRRSGGGGPYAGGVNQEDLQRQGGGPGGLFGNIFGGASAARGRAPRRGGDLETEVTLAFADAVRGVTVPLHLAVPASCAPCGGSGARAGTAPRTCTGCGGSGSVMHAQGGFALSEPCRDCRGEGSVIDNPCPECRGTGTATKERTITVRIPAGVADGQRIRLRGKGSAGAQGGPAGDLIVTTRVRSHPVFKRSGDHLTLTLPVTISEAALGAEITVPTLTEPVTLRIPPGTSSGRTFRVKGRGVERQTGAVGDLLVTVEVTVPQQLSSSARAALETLATEQPGGELRAHLAAEPHRG
ncbi:MAG TPA: molecular chaperone DnaJ [Mycobacteriales bacterium]|nr:molecular chaperone DnaJ [Mycobacteriales bacterium]